MVEGLGGRLDAFYFVFGENDVHVILDLPENLTAAAISLVVLSTGAARIRTSVLLTPGRDRSGGENAGRLPSARVAVWDWTRHGSPLITGHISPHNNFSSGFGPATVCQAKALEFPMVIVDIGSDFKRHHPRQRRDRLLNST